MLSTGKKNASGLSYYSKGDVVSTLYIGSKGKNIRSLLRVYDKKLEQEENHGPHYSEAIACKDWVRMENEITGKYAHSLTDRILKISSQEEQADLIGTCLLNKYTFTDKNGHLHKMSQSLADCIKKKDYYFSDVRYKDMSLQQSYEYLIVNSGLLPFLYKLWKLDKKAYEWFFKSIREQIETYVPNRDTAHWLKIHGEYYEGNGVHLKNDFRRRGTE